jgi:hypothetical protein
MASESEISNLQSERWGSEGLKKPTCICDGQRHWFPFIITGKILRTTHKTNPYCRAHGDNA